MNITLLPPLITQVSSSLVSNSELRIGDRVRVDFRGKTREVIIKSFLDEHTVVVTGEDLLLPVACSPTEIHPFECD
jgi:hypothetical protein